MGKSTQWTHEQGVVALDLYFRMPLGQLHSRNKRIIDVAALIGRSSSALSMKLCNFAGIDPDIKASGLQNWSQQDESLWKSYSDKRAELEAESMRYRTAFSQQNGHDPMAGLQANEGDCQTDEIRYWTYSPGNKACNWDDVVRAGVVALDFASIGDLRAYADEEALRADIRGLAGDEASHKNDVRALMDFRDVMKPGDLVFAKKGANPFLGVGRVAGEYEFDGEGAGLRHRRAVEWFDLRTVKLSDPGAVKTLTEVTPYPEFCLKLAEAYGIDSMYEEMIGRVWDSFLKRWPIERLESMTLEDYTKLGGKDSLCYWLESKLENLGSIWGGSAYKFGIFEYNKTDPKPLDKGASGDDRYRWYTKYGETAEAAFKVVKDRVVAAARAGAAADLDSIEHLDLSPVVKWKIAFLYQDRTRIPLVQIFKREMLEKIARVQNPQMSDLYRRVRAMVPDGINPLVWTWQNGWKGAVVGPGVKVDEVKKIEELSADDLSTFRAQLAAAGLQYDEAFVRRFFAAVQAKQFVVLTGLSGSGKTQLAIQFCAFVAKGRHAIVSVGADWTNNEKMLGYLDAVNCGKYVRPESGVLDLVLQASRDPDRPYVLVLDEMNLSHVERYFADFLSAMESKGDLKLHGGKGPVDGVPPTVKMPENLWVIGTMNVDETTYMFSPKVLDRAQVLEFRVKAEDMKAFLDGKQAAAAAALNGFFPELAKVGAEFGYRTAGEFCSYVEKAIALGSPIDEAVDTAIMQKLLPKLHGSRRQLERPLEALWKLCLKPDIAASVETLAKAEGEIDVFPYGNNCKYPISGEKIARIYKNAKNNGFASYAEA